ncbi:MAG: selenocysteine-specific translation elongation factor [Phenylobacterium sp.]|uniref:selenocysteine-specific translation elongation factor n=1 Tax=Phenylobacterium sp. TaxID=1871053 RepID=UPI0025EF33FC|nr:selenocysteine-specific translation elongation factor [Phenylobacterium sp.]MCG9914983.1 selenocysteine-specific translation elongation factor [Phenylobacterium sp.]
MSAPAQPPEPPSTPLSLAVIGHVNHGKTALVRALTGFETDRLAEEKARGLSIALGFAWRDYSGGGIEFLDAPGHEDFIRAMAMGTAGARAALLVVSAVEGVGRQTREHLRIASYLGVRAGLVAITKSDRLAAEDRPALQRQIVDDLADSFLSGEPVVFCSAVTGEGLDAVHAELEALAARAPRLEPLSGAFLPLDRVFSLTGAGTVVTGTLQGGSLKSGEEALLLPSGRSVSLRQLQVHGEAVETAGPGGRVAAGLRGVAVEQVAVGEVLCAPGGYEPALRVDVELAVAPDTPRPLKSGDELRVLWGARQDMARVRLIDAAAIQAGGRGLAQLRFASPTITHAGQRGVLRRLSPAETIGGVTVLDPTAPPLRARTLDNRRALLEAVSERELDQIAAHLAERDGGVVSAAEAARLSRCLTEQVRARLAGAFERLNDDLLASEAAIIEGRRAYLDRLAEAHRDQPMKAGAPLGTLRGELARVMSPALIAHVEQGLSAGGDIQLSRGLVALSRHDPFAALSAAATRRVRDIEDQFRAGGMTPPSPKDLVGTTPDDPALVDLLTDTGGLVSLRNVALRQTLIFHADALDAAVQTLSAAFPPPTEFTTAQAREALATSRKFIVPVLEHLDARGDTVRAGDTRQVVKVWNPN